MIVPKQNAPPVVVPGDFPILAKSFHRSLLAQNKSPRTIQSYGEAVRLLGEYLMAQGTPTNVAGVRREHVESFLADVLAHRKPTTAANRYRSLQQFFIWLSEEGEIDRSPMERMNPPTVPEEPPDVLSEDDIRRLLRACLVNWAGGGAL
jgi:site-specific recombinase XerD